MNTKEIKALLIRRSKNIRFSNPTNGRNPIDTKPNRLAIIKEETVMITRLITLEADMIATENNIECNENFIKKLSPTVQDILAEKVHRFLSHSNYLTGLLTINDPSISYTRNMRN
jgi:hypothetical protein